MLLLAPMHLLVFLLLLALLLLASLHHECCSMISLLLLFFLRPCRKSLLVPRRRLLHFPMPENSGPWSQVRPPSRGLSFIVWRNVKCLILGTGRLFRHVGMQKVFFQGPEEFSYMGECEFFQQIQISIKFCVVWFLG
jgi:hypothetical protein